MLNNEPFYNKTTEKVVAGFIAMLNNVKIRREDGTIHKVPLRYGGRTKYLKFIEQLKDVGYDKPQVRRKLPLMSFQIVDLEYDTDRQKSKIAPLRIQDKNDPLSIIKLFQPVPYNITIDLTIVARKESECFQIFEQIVPYFQPDFTINIKPIEGVSTHIDDVPFKILSSSFIGDMEDNTTIDEREFTVTFMAPLKYYSKKKTRKVIKIVDVENLTSGETTSISVNPLTADVGDDWSVKVEVFENDD